MEEMHYDIERVLVDEEVIRCRVEELGKRIVAESGDDPLLLIALLKGALVFVADLFRAMPVKLDMECINVASYHGGTESSGEVAFLDQKFPDVYERDVLLVDDILDTGLTLEEVRRRMLELGAKRVRTCVLLAKSKDRRGLAQADYTGFTIKDEFVVGYGLDYDGKFRNLPYVGVMKQGDA